MSLRPPPGRSGRTWLARRRATAVRAAELLDQKRRALLAEERRLAADAAAAAEAWRRTARIAERWTGRAVVLAGWRQLELVRVHTQRMAEADVQWRSWMGITYPTDAAVRPGDAGLQALGGTAALDTAATAHVEALRAGVRHAVAARAVELVRSELAVTRARQRALERRWVPLLTTALARLEAELDEQDRENAVRSRWLRAYGTAGPAASRSGGGGGDQRPAIGGTSSR